MGSCSRPARIADVRRVVVWSACWLALAGGASATAQESPPGAAGTQIAQASVMDRRFSLNLKAQSTHAALLELARLAGMQLLIRDGGLQQQTMSGLQGKYSLREALTALLAGSGYGFQQVNESTISIQPTGALRS